TLTTMQFPAAATPTEGAVFGLVTVPSSGDEGGHGRRADGAHPCLAVKARPAGQPEARPARNSVENKTSHLVPEDGWLPVCGAAARLPGRGQWALVRGTCHWDPWLCARANLGWTAYRRSMTPRMKAAWPACWRLSEMMLTSRTLSVTGGSQ